MADQEITSKSSRIINELLAKTQRKTPTVIRRNYSISRIRRFYIRKVTFLSSSFLEKLEKISKKFPKIEYLHPFFRTTISLMFGKNNYKATLFRIDKLQRKTKEIVNFYIKLIKHASNFYGCKSQKKAAFGRICSLIKTNSSCFSIIEKILVSLKKIAIIDPFRQSLFILGCTGAGKTSLLSKICRVTFFSGKSGISIHPYKVGHLHHNYYRWQIIKTPGLVQNLKKGINLREVQILNCVINVEGKTAFFVDVTGNKSDTLSSQLRTFESLGKIIKVRETGCCLNKTDLGWEKILNEDEKSKIWGISKKLSPPNLFIKTSFHDEIGLNELKEQFLKIDFSRTVKPITNHISNFRALKREAIENINKLSDKQLTQRSNHWYSDNQYIENNLILRLGIRNTFGIKKRNSGLNLENSQRKKESVFNGSMFCSENEEKVRELFIEKKTVKRKGTKNFEKNPDLESLDLVRKNIENVVNCYTSNLDHS